MKIILSHVSIVLLAAVGLAGCAEQESTSSAARLRDSLDRANTAVETWQHDGVVVTRQMQQQVVAPVMNAQEAFTVDLRKADDAALDALDLDTVTGIANGWRQLSGALGIHLAGYAELGAVAVEEAACECETDGVCDADPIDPTPTPVPDPTIPPTGPTPPITQPIAAPIAFKTGCRVAAGAANAACILICWRKCLLSPTKRRLCLAACEVAFATALAACDGLDEPWSN